MDLYIFFRKFLGNVISMDGHRKIRGPWSIAEESLGVDKDKTASALIVGPAPRDIITTVTRLS